MEITNTSRGPVATVGALTLATALALSSCATTADEPEGSAAGSTQEAQADPSPSPAVSPTGGTDEDGDESAPPFVAATETSVGEQAGAGAVNLLTDIRIGSHDGFDRVVFEYSGEGAPGWDVQYVDEAVSDGIGESLAVDGTAILQVRTIGVRYPEESDADAFRGDPGPIRLRVGETTEVVEVVYDHVFEGYGMTFIGTDGAAPFRVYRLESPTRLVVEVEQTP